MSGTILKLPDWGKREKLFVVFSCLLESEIKEEGGWYIRNASVVDKSVYTIGIDSVLTNSAYTLTAKNGLESYYDTKHYFRVENGTSGQKIIAKGLNDTYTNKGSGELYRSDGLLKAFRSFMSSFSDWVEDVRYVGSNQGKADAAKQMAAEVISQVNESNLIAFS